MSGQARLLWILLSLLGSLPWWLRRAVGRFFGRLFSLFPSRDREIAMLQLRKFGLGDVSLSEIYGHAGTNVLESLNLTPVLALDESNVSSLRMMLGEVLQKKTGALVLTAHIGNWDYLAALGVKMGCNLGVIARPARNPVFQELLEKIRGRYGVRTFWRAKISGARELLRFFREGGVVGALIDQDTNVESVQVPFFGINCRTPSGLVELAIRNSVPVFFVFSVRVGDGFLISGEKAQPDLTVEDLLLQYNRKLESVIRDYPSQWVWFHKRWRTPEANQTMSSKEYVNFLKSGL